MPYIAHLTTVHRPFDTRIFQKECRALAQAGYRVSLIAPHTTQEVINGVEIIPVPRFKRRLGRMTRGIWAVYRLARRLQADLYHFHDPELIPVGVLLKLTTRACVVYDVHENHPQQIQGREWLPRLVRRIASQFVEQIEKVGAAVVDRVVTATELIAARFPPHKTQIIRNYPLLEMVAPSLDDGRAYKGNYTLIYTGGLTNHRGAYQIVQALTYVKIPQTKLLVLGGNVDSETADAVRGMPGWGRVDYRGQVPFEEMYRHLHSAAVGLICNQPRYGYDLSQPNKLFEYLSAGLPVIASNFDLWKEIVDGNECGITVDPTTPQQIAEAIDYLLSHPEIRRAMGENARRVVREKYNWECESRNLSRLYREVLGQC